MTQLEIKFFWPLTEQIPLDLEYPPAKLSTELDTKSFQSTGISIYANNVSWNKTITLDADDLVIRQEKKPNIIRRAAYKMLGIKWQVR